MDTQDPNIPLSMRQQLLTAALRCHYADHATNIERPHCQGAAVVAYGPIALCATCDKMRSAVGRTHAPRRLPGAELAALIDAARALAQAEAHIAATVGLARAAGASWSQISDAVGLTRQGAQQRWGRVADRRRLSSRVDDTAQPEGGTLRADYPPHNPSDEEHQNLPTANPVDPERDIH